MVFFSRLIFSGKQMADDKTAKEYNIEGGSVLHLVRVAIRRGDNNCRLKNLGKFIRDDESLTRSG